MKRGDEHSHALRLSAVCCRSGDLSFCVSTVWVPACVCVRLTQQTIERYAQSNYQQWAPPKYWTRVIPTGAFFRRLHRALIQNKAVCVSE
jgi:hypothetical protein